eukprot:PLAT7715.2.p1 GENE.PLAT7715.2~~PLAT7715.2.p1  ORF type:complete len:337 (+),score=118.39 PLAT7715.2:59-1012(+)
MFDRPLKLLQRAAADRAQAKRDADDDVDYLRRATADALDFRLDAICRDFPHVLDLSTGSDILLDRLQRRDDVGTVIAGDASISRLRSLATARPDVLTVGCDEEWLPLKDDSVQLVTSNLALHWVNDLPAALKEVRRVLQPDGVFLSCMLGGDTLHELKTALAMAEQEREGGIGVHISPMAEVADAGSLLSGAGFAIPTVDTDVVTVEYPDAFVLMEHLGRMGENNAALMRRPLRRETLLAAAAAYQTLYGSDDGSVPATFQFIYMIGWAPAPTQAAPLRRGSAQHSLKDLGSLVDDEHAAKLADADDDDAGSGSGSA